MILKDFIMKFCLRPIIQRFAIMAVFPYFVHFDFDLSRRHVFYMYIIIAWDSDLRNERHSYVQVFVFKYLIICAGFQFVPTGIYS